MKKMCVVGVGTMGWSIAQVFSQANYEVVLCSRHLDSAKNGYSKLEASLERSVQRERMTDEERKDILSRITPGEYPDTKGCTLAVEAIPENMGAKKAVFSTLEEYMPEDAIFATNTSSLSITEIANELKDPSRLVGMHFFNPATIMKLVEVIGGVNTSQEVIDEIIKITEEIGKTPVQVEESAGFVVNRVLIPLINEGVCILDEGVATAEDIDTAMKLGANHPMGPLALGDLVGLDVCLAIMETLFEESGDPKYRPSPLLRKMVRAGKLGRKTGEGFFTYKK